MWLHPSELRSRLCGLKKLSVKEQLSVKAERATCAGRTGEWVFGDAREKGACV